MSKLSLNAVVFDFDGTLAKLNIDFSRMRQDVLEILSRYGVPPDGLRDLFVLEMIDALDGCLRVEDLSREFGLSVRTLQRLLQEQVGLSPKQLLLNVRLQRAIERLRGRGRRDRLSECASACGFADQSHMIRVFRTQTGRLPSAF